MGDSEFQRLEKAEQDVRAQIAQQRQTRDTLKTEYEALRGEFLEAYNAILTPLKASFDNLLGTDPNSKRSGLGAAIARCAESLEGINTSEDIAKLHSSLKVRAAEALSVSESTIDQLRGMNETARKLSLLVLGDGSRDVLSELQTRKLQLEQEDERLRVLQERYNRFFGDKNKKEEYS